MGANLSTPPTFPSTNHNNYQKYTPYNWRALSQSQAPSVNENSQPNYKTSTLDNFRLPESRVTPTATPVYGPTIDTINENSQPNYKTSTLDNFRLPESRVTPTATPVYGPTIDTITATIPPSYRKVANTKRIMTFHSSACWKGYLDASKASTNLIVVEFTAGWCRPCRDMEQVLKEFADKYKYVDFVKIDVDELFNVSRQYGVHTMPTFVLIKKAQTIDKVVGARKEELQMKLEKHI